ncbi:MAG TPA: glycosyltransferase family 39 protein [Pseudolysinimonas sp.]|nr:glycosyltransferase family 39 protein [Pseudolysinimonas sp.]
MAAAATGAAAGAISMIGSATPSLWGDEAASVLSAERSIPSLLAMVQRVDAVHGLYYLGLHVWIQLAGSSPFAVRAPSAVAIGLCVAGIVVLGSMLRGLRFGVLAGLLCAVLPRLTDIGSEARSYAFTAALATWLTVVLVRALRTNGPRTRVWVAYGVLLALGTWLFLYLPMIALGHLAVLLLQPTRARLVRNWAIAVGAAIAAGSPLVALAIAERGQIAYLASRDYHDPTSLFVSPFFENPAVACLGWALMVAGAVLSILRWRTGWHRWQVPAPQAHAALVPVAWLLVPSIVLIGSSTLIADYTPRYLAMCAPAAGLLMAIPLDAVARMPRLRWLSAVGVVAVLAVTAPTWALQRGPYAKNQSDWANISSQLATHARPGDAVAFDNSVRPSRKPRLALGTYPSGFRGLLDPTLKTPFTSSPTWYDQVYSLSEADALGRLDGISTIWLVEYATPGHTDGYGVSALASAGFHQVATLRTHRSAILEFTRR